MIKRIFGDLRLVVLDNAYDSLQSPDFQTLFSKTLALKIEGYRTVYPYGVLPVDTYDFIATHHLVIRERKEGPEVLMGYRFTTLGKSMVHRLPFQGLALLRSCSASEHEKALNLLLNRHLSQADRVTYGSSWTIRPDIRENKALKNFLKDVMAAMLVAQEESVGSVLRVSCGAPRIKTDQFFENLGYERLAGSSGILPAFNQASLQGEPAVMLRCTNFSEEARRLAELYRDFWENRRVLGPQETAAAGTSEVAKKEAA